MDRDLQYLTKTLSGLRRLEFNDINFEMMSNSIRPIFGDVCSAYGVSFEDFMLHAKNKFIVNGVSICNCFQALMFCNRDVEDEGKRFGDIDSLLDEMLSMVYVANELLQGLE